MAQSGPENHKNRDPLNEGSRKSGENSLSTVSWLKDSILNLPRRLIGSPPQEKENPLERAKAPADTELKVVADSEWLVIQKPGGNSNMSSSVATASSSSGSHHGPEDGSGHAKRRTTAGSRSQLSTPPTGRTSSVSSKNRPPRPSSPHSTTGTGSNSIHRKPSGRGSRPMNLEVQNGGSLQRSVSPNRVRHVSPSRGSGRTGSPISGSSASKSSVKRKTSGLEHNSHESKDSSSGTGQVNHVEARAPGHHSNGHHAAQATNGKAQVAAATVDSNGHAPGKGGSGVNAQEEEEVPTSSAFEKVRDTLRISRPKKKKKSKGKLAYSIVVDPSQMSTPEINLQHPDKYQDPFETSYAENGDTERKMDHLFKPASIPHNKPEYCDHCGDMAWGLYRQVLKCSSK